MKLMEKVRLELDSKLLVNEQLTIEALEATTRFEKEKATLESWAKSLGKVIDIIDSQLPKKVKKVKSGFGFEIDHPKYPISNIFNQLIDTIFLVESIEEMQKAKVENWLESEND